jgi:hypothetical protein
LAGEWTDNKKPPFAWWPLPQRNRHDVNGIIASAAMRVELFRVGYCLGPVRVILFSGVAIPIPCGRSVGPSMPAQLVALNEGFRILLDKPILLVGRDSECDIQLDSRKVSRRHCCIAQVSDYLVVRDLASTNGIRINGVRVVEGSLKSGDELTIGNNRYQVRWDAVPLARDPANLPSGKKGTPAPAAKPAPMHDESLESCDEPVALADSGVRLPKNSSVLEGPDPVRRPKVSPDPVVPEKLELRPISDIFPSVSPRKPPPK